MTDTKTKEDPTANEAQTDANAAPAAASLNVNTAPTVVKGGGKGLGVFAILLSLAALAGSGFTWYQTQISSVQEDSRLSVGVSQIGTQVARLGDQVTRLQQDQSDVVSAAELNNKVLEIQSGLDVELRGINSAQQAMQESVLKLNADLERGVDQFVVEEVAQLLRLANNSVLFGNDIQAAINALTLADSQLKTLRDPRYSLVRTAVNAELAALQGVKLPDVEALSAQLNSLAAGIDDLPLANEPESRLVEETAVSEPVQEMSFRSELKKIWRDLIGSVSIQRVDQPPKPLLAPDQRYFLNENISLALAKAELALLQGEPQIYQRSLGNAQMWLREYFALDNADVQAALRQLQALSAQDVTAQVPAITGSYQALQTILGGQ